MRVLHVYKSYYPDSVGGVERSIKNIIDGLKDKGIKSNLLTTHQKKKIPNQFSFKKNFQIFRTPFSLGFFLNFKSITNNFDIIHYHHPWPFMDLVHLIHNIKKISIVTYHSDIVRQKKLNFLYRPIMNKFLSKVDKIVCSSENYLKSSRVLKKFENKTLSIPFGIKKNDYKIKKKIFNISKEDMVQIFLYL
tara:strand:- start:6315 stop:6887 length:573 start_codon:yes stop_codon:yes gene_type:complete